MSEPTSMTEYLELTDEQKMDLVSKKRKRTPAEELVEAVEQAIVDLSVHPAGCVDYAWYENVCLEVADRLDNAVVKYKKQVMK